MLFNTSGYTTELRKNEFQSFEQVLQVGGKGKGRWMKGKRKEDRTQAEEKNVYLTMLVV